MPFPKPGEVPKPPEFKDFPIFFLIWLVMMVGGAFVQAIAMRWALKTKWSNFELVAVSTKEDESVKP